ncbi:MAG: SpoIIE family protein phosphatase [Phycisphaerales bacterium]
MRARTRFWLRCVGVALIAVGAVAFAVLMLVLGRADDPAQIIAVIIVAGLGLALVLLSIPRTPGATGGETTRDLLSVFFTFGTLGPMIMAVLTSGEANFLVGLVGIGVSGGISVLWALAFIRRAFWVIPIAVLVSAFGPPNVFRAMYELGGFENFGSLTVRARLGILGVESLASLIIGYALMIQFVSRVERAAARSEAELETAARIHAQLVPEIARRTGPWSVAAISAPSSTMGGDLVDLIERPDGTADLVIADVTGHGVRAGVVMALAKGIIRTEFARGGSLADAAGSINRHLFGLLDTGTFVTAAVVRLGDDGGVEALVAGHPPVLVRRAGGNLERIGTHGLPWGVSGDEAYGSDAVSLAAGDTVVLYTDGITEAADQAGAMLGVSGVERVVARAPEPGGLVAALLDAAAAHAPGRMDDDRSAAAAWYRENGPSAV